MKEKTVIVGAGPHSEVILDILTEKNDIDVVGFTDCTVTGYVLGYPIIGTDEILPELYNNGVRTAFVALGDNAVRKKVFCRVSEIGFELINAISTHSVVSRFTRIGKGVAIMPGAIVNAGARIGDGAIINTNASIDHDCEIGSFVHVAPGCAISGSTTIGDGSFLGTGCRVIDKVNIGNNVLAGAGTVIIRNAESGSRLVGIPARNI